MKTASVWGILALNVVLTVLGDALIKAATAAPKGMASIWFVFGLILYALPAAGWFLLMKELSLATIAVLYSASTLVLLTVIGAVVFHETVGIRELLAVGLALAAIVIGGKA